MKEYFLTHPKPAELLERAYEKWSKAKFYTEALVLSIDIGLQGIGVYLRKGKEILVAKTLLLDLPEAGKLEGRRLKRSWRHTRKNRATRLKRLKVLFEESDIPWVSDEILSKSDPYDIRYRAINKSLGSPQALSIAIRHIVSHRGYDYQAFAKPGDYLWGEKTDYKSVESWLASNYIDQTIVNSITECISEFEWKNDDVEKYRTLTSSRLEQCKTEGVNGVLNKYHSEKRPSKRAKARGYSFPRTMMENHLREILEKHVHMVKNYEQFIDRLFLKPTTRSEKSKAIFHYNRKTRKEAEIVWNRRLSKCPFSPNFGFGVQRVGSNTNPDIGVWNALMFLISRRIEIADTTGHRALVLLSEATTTKLIETARANRLNFATKNALIDWKITKKLIQDDIAAIYGKTTKITKDSEWNKGVFTQLQDIVKPSIANLNKNSTLASDVAKHLFELTTNNGRDWNPENIKTKLHSLNYYKILQNTRLGHINVYPQVEYLLGMRKLKNGHSSQLSTGRLHKLFTELSDRTGGQMTPDYCIIETIKNPPRNQKQKAEILKEQEENRKKREEQFSNSGQQDTGSSSKRRRLSLYNQQGGISPYTGVKLPHYMDPSLEIEHMFPSSRGGLSCDENLVITTRGENTQKDNMTPAEAVAAKSPGWLSLKEQQQVISGMKWSKRKKEIFEFAPANPNDIPDFGNTTRTSQLARQFIESVAAWMEISDNLAERQKRIGTPSGWITAQARKSWLDKDYQKNRGQLTHHIVDAAIIGHIPPANGMSSVNHGGIFYIDGDCKTRAIKDLGPNCTELAKWTADDAPVCPVEKRRGRKRCQPLGDETFWRILPPDANGKRVPVQRAKLNLGDNKLQDGHSLRCRLVDMGIPAEEIPGAEHLQELINATTGNKNDKKILRLNNGTPVFVLHKKGAKGGFETPVGWSGRPNSDGSISSARCLALKNDRLELWRGGGECYTRVIPDKTTLKHAKKVAPGWWERNRKSHCGFLPPFAKKLCAVRKGDTVLIPLNKDGEIDFEKTYLKWWYVVSAIGTNGNVKLKTIIHTSSNNTLLADCGKKVCVQNVSAPEKIAQLFWDLADV